MVDEEELELELDTEEPSTGSKKKLLIIILAVLVVLLGLGAFILLGGDSETTDAEDDETSAEVIEKGPADYVEFNDAFTVNLLEGRKKRMLQIKTVMLVRSDDARKAVKKHMPLLHNNLLILLSKLDAGNIRTLEAKLKLKQEMQAEINKIMQQKEKIQPVENIYFVSFVMQ